MTHIVTTHYRYKRPPGCWLMVSGLCAMICLAIAGPALSAGNRFDGVYTGKRVLTKGSPQACPNEDDVSVTIKGDALLVTTSRLHDFPMGFDPQPDGSFGQISSGGPGVSRIYPGAHYGRRPGRRCRRQRVRASLASEASCSAMTIVTTHYRYKRPPRKRKPNPVALTMPRIVTAKTPKPRKPGDPPIRRTSAAAQPADTAAPANDDRKSALVTIRSRKHATLSHPLDDMPPEEHKRRGDAADAMWRDMKRRLAEKPTERS